MDNRPIFFIGEGRSGTTVIFEAFSKHDQIAYLSNYTDKFYFPQVGFIQRLFNKQGKKPQYSNNTIFNKFLPKPSEAYNTWEKLSGKKFRNSFMRDIIPTNTEIKKVNNYIEKIKKYQGKKRFSTKFTGPPRITYLNNIFKDAYFVNIIRDPRAVVASLLNVEFRIKKGFEKAFWENTLTDELHEIWIDYDKTSVALAALEWRSIYEQIIYEREKNNAKVYDLKYEEFVRNPINSFENIMQFVNIDFSDNVIKYVKKNDYKNMNYKYKERLSEKQVNIVEEICEKAMVEMNYLA